MAHQIQTRDVRCYHCGTPLVVPASARSGSCTACHNRLMIDDLLVDADAMWSGPLATCGRVSVRSKARVNAKHIAAAEGIEISGDLAADLSCWGVVKLSRSAVFAGECRAKELVVEAGAIISSARFEIGPGAFDSASLPGATE